MPHQRFHAARTAVTSVIDDHVGHHYPKLPKRPMIGQLVPWFVVCQWNARAALYRYFVERIQQQCEEAKGAPCTRTEACGHLAVLVGKSPRQLLRMMKDEPWPAVTGANGRNGNGNGNGNGHRNGGA